jgi:Helix-turn-helix domain
MQAESIPQSMKSIESLTAEEERAAEVFRALGNPARIRIVAELARRQACVTSDLVDLLPLAQSTVSQHLKVLKEAGIVQGSLGGDPCYCLNPDVMRWVARFSVELCCPPDGESAGACEAPGCE